MKPRLGALLTNALDDLADFARRRVQRGSALRRWLGQLRKPLGLRPPRSEISRFLLAWADTRPHAYFVQIGSNDGRQQDPLEPVLERFDWRGILVEPVPYVFEQLFAHRGGDPRFILENAAIADRDGTQPFYYLPKAEDTAGLPRWYDALGSFHREVLLKHVDRIPDIAQRVCKMEVACLSFDSLCRKHRVERVDLLHMDVEGYDWQLIRTIDLQHWRPVVLIYERHHMDAETRAVCEAHLRGLGYTLVSEGLDTMAVRTEAVHPRVVEALERCVRACARSQYLVTRHPPDSPGAPNADHELRADHPELAELRRRYAGHPAGARVGKRWTPQAVARGVDLRQFRGETLYLWHYREDEAATRAKYLAWTRATLARDHMDLLNKLGEDGAYGCWTFAFEGLPPVSRDLLDSVNELYYLDRQLRVLQRPGLRILDIGAGYGRLAHRFCAAAPHLADYCCVDGVAESTFVSSHYLGFRGCMPPARVVALDRVETELTAGSFDLAVNIHSFPECPRSAISWWIAQLRRLRVPDLLIVPNDGKRLLSLEADGRRLPFEPLLEAAGYRRAHTEPVFDDAALQEQMAVEDAFVLFRLDT